MIVVADTSPLNYLLLIEEIDLLPTLFGTILIPQAVFQELQHPRTSQQVKDWMTHPPAWLELRSVTSVPSAAIMALDPGEREAIQLALELEISTVLIDEATGRKYAEELHLEVRGTLGVLERGARLGLTQFRPALARLEQTNFRISPAVKAAFLKRNP
jgi:predicted nucleic acid-binding protein